MNSLSEPGRWQNRRWLGLFGLIFIVQVGLIFILSDRKPAQRRALRQFPVVRVASPASAEFLALLDPTLFALPNRQGFSSAWLKWPRIEFRQLDWSEPTNWLGLSLEQLGTSFKAGIETGSSSSLLAVSLPEPRVARPEGEPLAAPKLHSAWRLEGALSARRLLQRLELPSWPHTELLTNSVVQLVIDAQGRPCSLPILLTSSGHKEADDLALNLAKRLRFEPIGGSDSANVRLDLGRIIFDWSTVPSPATSAAPAVIAP